jgi:hypothetical protein
MLQSRRPELSGRCCRSWLRILPHRSQRHVNHPTHPPTKLPRGKFRSLRHRKATHSALSASTGFTEPPSARGPRKYHRQKIFRHSPVYPQEHSHQTLKNPEGDNHEKSRLVGLTSANDQHRICTAPPSSSLSRLEGQTPSAHLRPPLKLISFCRTSRKRSPRELRVHGNSYAVPRVT